MSLMLETTLSSSLTILTIFLLLSTTTAAATATAANPFCDSATDGVLCTTMAKGATNWQEAMTNVITSVIAKAKARQSVAYGVAAKLPHNLQPQTKESVESTCKEAFDTLIGNMEKCLGYVKSDPESSLKYYLSGFSFFDCQNALEELGISVPEVNQFNEELMGMNTNLIAVMEKNTSYV